MTDLSKSIYGVSSWYSTLADHTFPTTFVKLKDSDLELIATEAKEGIEVEALTARIKNAQAAFSGATFVFADTVAPTDTARFADKKGAVHSAQSAWNNLVMSEKVRISASKREFEFICIRPFRNMTYPREFRLFIYEGSLKLMSQMHLDRPYQRLLLRREFWWNTAKEFVDEISWLLPQKTIVMDIYFTSKDQIMIIDLNKWGEPTRTLLAGNWNMDWSSEYGLKLME